MKIFRYLTALVMALVTFTACEQDQTDMISKDVVAPVMDEHASILMTKPTADETVSFTWKAARNLAGTVTYHLYAAIDNESLQLGSTEATFYTLPKAALRQALLDGFNKDGNENFDINVYVIADNGVQSVESGSVTVTCYVWGDFMAPIVEIDESIPAEGLVLSDEVVDAQPLLSWSEAKFEAGQDVTYKIEIVLPDGSRVTVAEKVAGTSYTTTYAALNTLLLSAGYAKDMQHEITFVVTAFAAETPDYYAESLESEPVKINITTYTPAYPEFLYMVGGFNGLNWKDTAEQSPRLTGDPNTGIYHGIVTVYNGDAKFFYVNPRTEAEVWVGGALENSVWKLDSTAAAENMTFSNGTYILYVDLGNNTMYYRSVTKLGLIGSATFNGTAGDWSADVEFTFNEETLAWELKGLAVNNTEGAFKARVNGAWGDPNSEEMGYNFGLANTANPDLTALVHNGSDIPATVVGQGTFDVVMNFSGAANYAMTWTLTGEAEEIVPDDKVYGLCGDHNGWGTPDPKFVAAAEEGWFVLKGFEATAGGQFKVRVNDAWTEGWGVSAEVKIGETYTLSPGGMDNNLVWAESGVYDVYWNPTTLELYVTAGVPVTYNLVGSMNGWNVAATDYDLTNHTNGGYKVFKGVSFAANDEFKIAQNHDWAVSFGLPADTSLVLGEAITLTSDNGANIVVAEAGDYDVYFHPDTKVMFVVVAGADDPTVAPEPEQPAEDVYSIAGTCNEWGETDMVKAKNGFYVAAGVEFAAAGEFKFKKNHSWADADCWGVAEGTTVTLGEPIALIQPGGNIVVPAGTYDLYLNPATDVAYVVTAGSEDPTGPAGNVSIYGLVGDLNGWNAPDVKFTDTGNGEHVLLGQTLTAGQGFKIRANEEWNDAENYGISPAGNVAIDAEIKMTLGSGSQNMSVETTGTYDLYFYPADLKLYVMTPGKTPADAGEPVVPPTPEKDVFSIAGTCNGWADTDMEEAGNGVYKLAGVTFAQGDEIAFKFKKNHSWADANCWGVAEGTTVTLGEPIALIQPGGNIFVQAGTYDIYFIPASSTAYVVTAGANDPTQGTTPTTAYSLVGTMNGWNVADTTYDMIVSGSIYTIQNVKFDVEGAFKVVEEHSWDNADYGLADGVTMELGKAVQLAAESQTNIPVAAGIYDMSFDAEAKTITVTKVGDVDTSNTVYTLAGTHNGWNGSDAAYQFVAEGDELALKGVVFSTAGEFKVVANGASWYGGTLSNGVVALSTSGNNVAIEAGTYDMYLNVKTMELRVSAAQTVEPEQPATPAVLEWGNDLFETLTNQYGSGVNVEEDIDFGNGLTFTAGGGKGKFGSNDGAYRFQLGGTGNGSKCVLNLPVTGPGTLTIDIQSSGSVTDPRTVAVDVDGSRVNGDGANAIQEERQVYTIECSAAKAGSIVQMYSTKSGINIFNIKWTPAQ
ncbi:MAG: SusE domain-containing protein [Alistipes sp.]|nr:SusE domain-containing protein [Alistipes sp.]